MLIIIIVYNLFHSFSFLLLSDPFQFRFAQSSRATHTHMHTQIHATFMCPCETANKYPHVHNVSARTSDATAYKRGRNQITEKREKKNCVEDEKRNHHLTIN